MRISIKIYLANGVELDDATKDFPSAEAAHANFQQVLSDPNNVLTWTTADGPVFVLAVKHIVGFVISAV